MTIQTGGFSATAARPGLLFGAGSEKKKAGADDAAPETTESADVGDQLTLGGEAETPTDFSGLFDNLDLSGAGGTDEADAPTDAAPPDGLADELPPDSPDKPKKGFKFDQAQVHGILNKVKVLIAGFMGFENPEMTGWFDILVKGAKMFLEKSGATPPVPGKA